MEQPSLFEAIVRFPGALIRLPSTAKDTLDAINALAERVDRLVSLLEQFEPGMNLAGAGMDVATSGISQAIVGLQQAVGTLDGVIPGMSASTAALRGLTDRMGWKGVETIEVVARSDEEPGYDDDFGRDPEDPALDELSAVVNDLIRLFASSVGTIPGVRQVFRVSTAAPSYRDEH